MPPRIANYAQRSTLDPAAKATFAEAARCWQDLARCWRELQKQPARGAALLDFTSESSERQAARMAPTKIRQPARKGS